MNTFLDISDDIKRSLQHEIRQAKKSLYEDRTQTYFRELDSLRPKYPNIISWTKEVVRYAPAITSLLLNTYRNSGRSYLCLFVFKSLLDAYQYIATMPMFYRIRLQKICIKAMTAATDKEKMNAILLGFYYLFRIIEHLATIGKSFRAKVAEMDTALRFIESVSPNMAYRDLRDYWFELLLQYIPPKIASRIGEMLSIITDPNIIRTARIGVSNALEIKLVKPTENERKYFESSINKILESPEAAKILMNKNYHYSLIAISIALLKTLSSISSEWTSIDPFDLVMADPSRYTSIKEDETLGKKIYDLCISVNSFLDKLHIILDTLDKKTTKNITSLTKDAKKLITSLLEDSGFLTNKDKHVVDVPRIGKNNEITYEQKIREKENNIIRSDSLEKIDKLKTILEKINSILIEQKSTLQECIKNTVRIFGFFSTLDPLIGLKKDDIELIVSYFDKKGLWKKLRETLNKITKKTLKDIITV
ncbi:MAG: hypothetical protein Q6363_003635 [Candidatus Njordarchaeota archaeon]